MIQIKSSSDVRIGYFDRYFLIRDTSNTVRVVSVPKLAELSPYIDSSGNRRYKFATHPGGYQHLHSQSSLHRDFVAGTRGDAKQSTKEQISQLVAARVICIVGKTATTPIQGKTATVTTTLPQFEGGYVIGSVVKGSNELSFSSNPKIHATAESAEAEANRLANAHPGKEFVVFRATMSAVKASVVTRKFD